MRLDPFAVYRFVYGAEHPDRLKIMRREARRKLRAAAAMEGCADGNRRPGACPGSGPIIDTFPRDPELERTDDSAQRAPPMSIDTARGRNPIPYINVSNDPDNVAQKSPFVETGYSASSASSAGEHVGRHNAHYDHSHQAVHHSHRHQGPQSPNHCSGWPPRQSPYQEQPPLYRRSPHPGISPEPTVQVTVVDLTAPRRGGQAFCYALACTRAQLAGLHELLAPPRSGRLLALRIGDLPAAVDAPWPTSRAEFELILACGVALTVEIALDEETWSWADDRWA